MLLKIVISTNDDSEVVILLDPRSIPRENCQISDNPINAISLSFVVHVGDVTMDPNSRIRIKDRKRLKIYCFYCHHNTFNMFIDKLDSTGWKSPGLW